MNLRPLKETYPQVDDFSKPWRSAANRLCDRNAQRIFEYLVRWDKEYMERVDAGDTWPGSISHTPISRWHPGPLYAVQIPVAQGRSRKPKSLASKEVAYFPKFSVTTTHSLVNLGIREETRQLVADLWNIPQMPMPFRSLPPYAAPGMTTPAEGFKMTKEYKGKFRLCLLGHARSHLRAHEDMFCPFCPALKLRNGRELFRHCIKMDHRHKTFPQIMDIDDPSQSFMLCGDIWDEEHLIRRYRLERSDLPMGGQPDFAAAHRGFGKYFQLRYKEAYVTWLHARWVPGMKAWFDKEVFVGCWELVNVYLRW